MLFLFTIVFSNGLCSRTHLSYITVHFISPSLSISIRLHLLWQTRCIYSLFILILWKYRKIAGIIFSSSNHFLLAALSLGIIQNSYAFISVYIHFMIVKPQSRNSLVISIVSIYQKDPEPNRHLAYLHEILDWAFAYPSRDCACNTWLVCSWTTVNHTI